MSQAIENSPVVTDFRIRPRVLMDFAHVWAERHGERGRFSITRLSEKIKTRVITDLQHGQAVDVKLRSGQPVKMVDLSDDLSGFVYYAMVQKSNGFDELSSIVDAVQLEELIGDDLKIEEENPADSPSQSEEKVASQEKKCDLMPDELVLLRYSNCDGNEHTEEVKRGELNGMILKLLADGIEIGSMKVWSNGRRPQIDVRL